MAEAMACVRVCCDVAPAERTAAPSRREEFDGAATKAEGGLASDAGVIEEQARQVQPLNEGENLLKVSLGKLPVDETT